MNNIDKLDENIISELQAYGFQKSSSLAMKLGVCERTVANRINKLKSNNLIRIVAVPNPMLTSTKAWAKIGIKVEPRFLRQVARELTEHPLIYFVAYSLGTFDIIIAANFDSVDDLTKFVNSELININGITSTETMMLVHPRKYYNFTWPAYENSTKKNAKVGDLLFPFVIRF